uniref:Peptidase M16 N-terminal domain-containing protein n=1 Tax=Leptocylindrus danicus TaxID=163516 RepID=A0A7S2JT78_9STRA|mmetsp:Transcript_10952/g.16522  ORF Transcript_10952/g.16522 Transcript_10952/m.16522 type:complete len:454 (+) Transcript_10952:128-1489(+)|eukprot:CAMPEP_0116028450 /NCGR_PEP_ID=MMETSP0321-20121206/15412_1 /TAXON_ID=163516 /ORGANISM="Leptocylindrus danicus var. danicus, Strain B650" /LENGTH=453 /DNA_ID=CAMNT_0003502359 /DNA_START=89 /DNA_END=1450 /DNA_ORIENTATION=+
MATAALTATAKHAARNSLSRAAATAVGRRNIMMAMAADDEDIPGLPDPMTLASMSTLKSSGNISSSKVGGLNIVTDDGSSSSSVLFTLKNAGGSAAELSGEAGAAAVNAYLTYKSSSTASTLKTLRDMNNSGAQPYPMLPSKASRTSAQFGYTCAPEHTADLVANLAMDCAYTKWDVQDAVNYANIAASTALACPANVCEESIYVAAYGDASSMSNSVYCSNAISRDVVASFREREYYGAASADAVLVATGVADHDAFVAAVTAAFGTKEGASSTPLKGEYRGGESRVPVEGASKTYLRLAFAAPYCALVQDIIVATLQAQGVEAFAQDGVLGVSGDANVASTSELVDTLVAALAAPITAESAAKGKLLAKASALMALEGTSSTSLAQSLTTGAVLGTEAYTPQDLAAAYDDIAVETVVAEAAKMKESVLAVSAVGGGLAAVPYHPTLAAMFK